MKKRQRIYFLLFLVTCLALSLGAALYAVRDGVSYFLSPSEIAEKGVPPGRVFRLGGMVEAGSVEKRDDDLVVRFAVTDYKERLDVAYSGLLPDLFREGQGVVATGSLDENGVFVATQLLAKHDEKYMPPDVARKIDAGAAEKGKEDP